MGETIGIPYRNRYEKVLLFVLLHATIMQNKMLNRHDNLQGDMMSTTTREMNNSTVQKQMKKLVEHYEFSLTELSHILKINTNTLRDGFNNPNVLIEQEQKNIDRFTFHIRLINLMLEQDENPRRTSRWFFENLDDNYTCTPRDIYVQQGFIALRDLLQAEDKTVYLNEHHPEYKELNKFKPVIAEDGEYSIQSI